MPSDRTGRRQSQRARDRGPPYKVLWHPDAEAEKDAIQDKRERAAIQNAVEKLVQLGPRLPFPHQSAVQGESGKGLRELRPRGGRSPWRPLYRQVEAAGKRAKQRLADVAIEGECPGGR